MPSSSPPLLLLAGVPGAGKTEALRRVHASHPDLRIADPEAVRDALRLKAPCLPYSLGRPIVHTIAHCALLIRILRIDGRPLIVHDPGTRRWSRSLMLRLALWRGWDPIAIFIDVDRTTALAGQARRGRIVRTRSFHRHWYRWTQLRPRIIAGRDLSPGERWPRTHIVDRDSVITTLNRFLGPYSEVRS